MTQPKLDSVDKLGTGGREVAEKVETAEYLDKLVVGSLEALAWLLLGTGMDCHEDMSKELGVDKQVGKEPALLGFWHTSCPLVIPPATRRYIAPLSCKAMSPRHLRCSP